MRFTSCLLYILAFMLFCNHGKAQIILADPQVRLDVAPTVYVFRDTSMRMSLQEVIRADQFTQNDRENLYMSFHEHSVLWVRLPFVNASEMKTFLIDIRNATVDDIQLYEPQIDGTYHIQQVGDAFPFRYRKIFSRAFTFEIVIKERETKTYYLRIDSHGDAINLPLEIWQPIGFLNKTANEKYVLGIYYGCIFFIIVFHLFLFTRMRDKNLIYYMLYIMGIAGMQLAMDGFLSKYFLPDHPWLVNRLMPAFIFMASATLVGFFQHYFGSRKHLPHMNVLLEAEKYIAWVGAALCFTWHEWYLYLMKYAPFVGLIIVGTILVGAGVVYRKEPVLARYFIAAFLFMALGVALNLAHTMGIYIAGGEYGVKIGAGCEIVVLAFALAEKFKMMEEEAKALAFERLENLNALKDQYNKELEETVSERTSALAKSNQNIRDSIKYAKRIQTSLLPNESFLDGIFPDYFIYYRPRDIVSGDFYWYTKKDSKIYLAVVDCTGHGVPGAFMSILGISYLNEIVNAQGISSPDEILLQLNGAVKRNLKQMDDNAQSADGMDAALICYDTATNILQFAGAKRPLYYFSKGEMHMLKGSQYSIGGKKIQQKEFELYTLEGKDVEAAYMFTDGYADQFGGPEDKKFLIKNFRELLEKIKDRPMSMQQEYLDHTHLEWKGRQQQLDDILVIGFKLRNRPAL